ncbi:Cytochrome P450 52A13 [Spathaspora sp. JA1]|nr:Cytochrome P450 52A13 [Spathaspora sp. JA1]
MQVVDYLNLVPNWLVLLIGVYSVYSIATYIKRVQFKRKHGTKPIPDFPDTGILGLKFAYTLLTKKKKGDLLDYIHDNLEHTRTYNANLFGLPIIMTTEPENVKAMLSTQFNQFSLGRNPHLRIMLGDGIFTLDGEGWKHSRQMLRPQFVREQVSHVSQLESHLLTLAKHITKNKGRTFDIQELFFRFTVDTATEFLFGESVHSLHDETVGLYNDNELITGFAEAFDKTQKYLGSRVYTQSAYFLVDGLAFRKAIKKVHQFTKLFVNKALEMSSDELEKKSQERYTFLYELTKSTRNPQVLQDQLLNILLAGRDTTAGTLSFCFFELARNPKVWHKLKQEVNAKFDKDDLSNITFESLKSCEYLKWVINETLRLYPSVAANYRRATQDTTLPLGGGPDGTAPIFVSKGSTVAYCYYSIHRLEDYFGKDAKEFNPERWESLDKLGWQYLPFNGGPRICLGQQFALTEIAYVVVRLVQMFPNLESRDERPYPPMKACELTLRHNDGVYIEMSA